jgi:hypothetical protein
MMKAMEDFMRLWTFFAGTTAALAGAFVFASQNRCAKREAQVDNTIEDSFPASDPPSWTSDVGTRCTTH